MAKLTKAVNMEQQINTEYAELKAKIEAIEIGLALILAQMEYRNKIIKLRNSDEIRYFYVCTIDAVQIDNYLCKVFVGSKIAFRYSNKLKNAYRLLYPYFEQINKNTIVNINKIAIICHKRQLIKLKSGLEFSCSEEKVSEIEYLMDIKNGIFNKK